MSNNWLYEKYNYLEEEGILEDISSDILSSLKMPLRFYQENATKRFIHYFEKSKNKTSNHVLFEMATGSGKTLTMATLMLYLYKKGYRNFVFFVSSSTIVEKTKENFVNKASSKHLFNNIEIDNLRVEVKAINNLEEASSNAINIIFTTIQGLHIQLLKEKENALTIEDLKEHKLVLLGDEAHHLSSSTKSKQELELENSWETTVKKIFESNSENILLEFTATAETSKKEVQEKYYDKLLYKYSLKEFCTDGFSKNISMIINRQDNQERILLSLLVNIFREELLSLQGIPLKPVILFKSDKINNSTENEKLFIKIIETIQEKDIEKILLNIRENSYNSNLLQAMLLFFDENKINSTTLVYKLQSKFQKEYILNVNNDKEKENNQILLNSLEDYNNKIRAIFAVDKLNEGWDVLNLFDIVKLYATKSNNQTTKEAQLIGRGARYYPFYITEEQKEDKYKRKYDQDASNPLKFIEQLHYHTMDESSFVNELNKELEAQGLLLESSLQEIDIKLKEEFKNTKAYKEGVIYVNKKQTFTRHKKSFDSAKQMSFFNKDNNTIPKTNDINVEHKIISNIDEKSLEEKIKETFYNHKIIKLKDIDFNLFYKAISKNKFFIFEKVKILGLNSIKDIYEYYGNSSITFLKDTKQLEISNKDIIKGLLKLLEKLQKGLSITEFIGTDFTEKKAIKDVFKDKKILVSKDKEVLEGKNYTYFMQNNFTGTSEETDLIATIESYFQNKEDFKEIYLLRNERHFRLYKFEDGTGFEPDFVLFVKNKQNEFLNYQIFIEPKGKHLQEFDRWKESFITSLEEKYPDAFEIDGRKKQKIIGLPFYNHEKRINFLDVLETKIVIE